MTFSEACISWDDVLFKKMSRHLVFHQLLNLPVRVLFKNADSHTHAKQWWWSPGLSQSGRFQHMLLSGFHMCQHRLCHIERRSFEIVWSAAWVLLPVVVDQIWTARCGWHRWVYLLKFVYMFCLINWH
jgi:hypothetical protein